MIIKESLRSKLGTLRLIRFAFLFFFGLQCTCSHADFTGVRLGVSYPTPLGMSFQTLDHTVGGSMGAWYSPSWLDPTLLQLRLSTSYEPFFVRNYSTVSIGTASLQGGIQIQAGVLGSGFMSYLGVDLGAVYHWMMISSATTAVTPNSSFAFSTQIVPGFDYSVTQNFGVVLEAPIRFVFLRSPLSLWSSSISLRLKL